MAYTRAPQSINVGYAGIRITEVGRDFPRVFILGLKVEKDFRRKGIGTKIMNLVVEKFGENDDIHLFPSSFGSGDMM